MVEVDDKAVVITDGAMAMSEGVKVITSPFAAPSKTGVPLCQIRLDLIIVFSIYTTQKIQAIYARFEGLYCSLVVTIRLFVCFSSFIF